MKEGIEDIAKKGVTEEELDKVKKFKVKSFNDSQNQNGYWQQLIMQKATWNLDGQKDYVNLVNSVSSEDIMKFVNKYLLKHKNTTTVVMLPSTLLENK